MDIHIWAGLTPPIYQGFDDIAVAITKPLVFPTGFKAANDGEGGATPSPVPPVTPTRGSFKLRVIK